MKLLQAGGVAVAAALALAACGSDPESGAKAPTPAVSSLAGNPGAAASTPPGTGGAGDTASTGAQSGSAGDGSGQGECPGAEAFCVGVVTDTGKIDDKSFNQFVWEGALEGAKQTGGYAKYIESIAPLDFASNIDTFVKGGYDVVVTVGGGMSEATTAAATANPNVRFIGVDQFQVSAIPNLTGVLFREVRAGYAAGYLAGLMTKTNKIGAVLATDTAVQIKLYGEGYKAGALAANPSATVTLTYHEPTNAFTDPEWGALEARKQISQGHDIIFGVGGLTGDGALLEVAKSPGAGQTVFCIGVDVDQYYTLPEAAKCLLTSAEKKVAISTADVIKLVQAGQAPGGNYTGRTGLAPYHNADAIVPAEVKALLQDVITGLENGTVITNVPPP